MAQQSRSASIDLFTRECLAIGVGRGLGGQEVAASLERLGFDRGLPQRIYCDYGPEFVTVAMDLWAAVEMIAVEMGLARTRRTAVAGKPTDTDASLDEHASGPPDRRLFAATTRMSVERLVRMVEQQQPVIGATGGRSPS